MWAINLKTSANIRIYKSNQLIIINDKLFLGGYAMKKYSCLAIIFSALMFLSPCSALATNVYWDLNVTSITPANDGLTGIFREMTFYAETTVVQFDDDGTPGFSVGDSFIDNGSLFGTALNPVTIDNEGLGYLWEATAPINNFGGIVTDIDVDPVNLDTRIEYSYTSGTVNLYVDQPKDADFSSRVDSDDSGFDNGTLVATFNLTYGLGYTFLDFTGGDVENQGSGEFQFTSSYLLPGFWYDESGNDISDMPLSFFISFVDFNVDDPILTAGDGTNFLFTTNVTHDGSIEFVIIPEPATMLLLGAGLIGLAGIGRRKFFKK